MTIQSLIIHYDEIRENRNTVLYFLVDSLKTSKSDFSQVKNRVVNFDSMGPGSFERSETQNSKIDKYLIALAIAIVILFLVIAIKLSQSKKLKRR